jgi:hypothetical protein
MVKLVWSLVSFFIEGEPTCLGMHVCTNILQRLFIKWEIFEKTSFGFFVCVRAYENTKAYESA